MHHCQNTLYLNNIFQKKTYKNSSFALWGDKVSEKYSQTTVLAPLVVFFPFLEEILFQIVFPGSSLYKDSFQSCPNSSSFNRSCILKTWQTSNVFWKENLFFSMGNKSSLDCICCICNVRVNIELSESFTLYRRLCCKKQKGAIILYTSWGPKYNSKFLQYFLF